MYPYSHTVMEDAIYPLLEMVFPCRQWPVWSMSQKTPFVVTSPCEKKVPFEEAIWLPFLRQSEPN